MGPGQWLLLALSIISITLLAVMGKVPERAAASAFVVAMIGSPLVESFDPGGVRWGVFALSVGLLIALGWLALCWPRWWLLAAAGVQLLSVTTFLGAILRPDTLLWASVSVRQLVWLELMVLGLAGIIECHRAAYATR